MVITAYFNERGYKVITAKGESRYIYDLPSAVVNDASALYTCRWMVLNQMMEIIHELSETIEDKDLGLYTDSRLIEELQGDLTPNNEYARSSLRYFIECDYIKFRRVIFQKCGATTINGKISEPIDQSRPRTA